MGEDEFDLLSLMRKMMLVLIATASFYYQALITEDRFVPALNVISKRFSMSPDVAGATLMAAGASSPELFAALTSIFITHSALGIGTVVGSEIFNQLVICSGAIFASKHNLLVLDPVSVVRDVIFYIISLGLLFNALSDRRMVEDGSEHIFITVLDSYLLVGCYILYVVTCAKFDRILIFLNINRKGGEEEICHYEASESRAEEGGFEKQISLTKVTSKIPFIRSCANRSQAKDEEINNNSSVLKELYAASESGLEDAYYRQDDSDKHKSRLFRFDKFRPRSQQIHGIDDIERFDDGFALYLWQRSSFYDMTRIDMNAWQLRWFKFTNDGIISTPHRTTTPSEEKEVSILPKFSSFDADELRLMMRVRTQTRDFVFLSPSKPNFAAAIDGFGECLNLQNYGIDIDESIMNENENHTSLIALPRNGFSAQELIIYCITFPIKALVQYTIPDVRSGTSVAPQFKAGVAAFASIISLIVASYFMATSLEELARELRIPESIVGATISAAGTSLPNLISSRCAAKLGHGDMAISNVMGSNTFNILVGLGVPWMVYTVMFQVEYSDLPSDGIDESMAVMAGSLLLFILILLKSRCRLFLWHAYLFIILYAMFVTHIVMKYFIGDVQ